MATRGALSRALSHRDSRIFFGGSMVAWTGLWMQRIAVSWLAWELTGSAFWVGMVAFCDLAPAVVISPLAGAVADRVDRVKLAIWTQVAIALQAAAVAGITASGHMTIGILLALEVLSGIAGSFAQPARQTLMPGIVPRADLPAAVAANSLTFAVARFVGPAIAGPVIAAFGVVPAIAANAVGYLISGLSLLMLNVAVAERRGHAGKGGIWADVADGVRYAARHAGLGPLLLYAAITAMLLRGVQEVLPPYVERIYGLGAESLAILTACFGVGALVAGLWVAGRGKLAGTTRLAVWSGLAQAGATAGFVATGFFPLGMLSAALIGAFASVQGITVQTLIQSATDAIYRGRMLSLWGLITRACPALGALALGAAGEAFGLRMPTLAAVGLFLVAFSWGLWRLKRMQDALEAVPPDPAGRS
ncbi:MFS transporter [Falsiroseomonas bella]|uniref:MFS transporter n=1 Tax=Falsiroseomonas bella TaxID=2184016 RepID=A0A317F579_9PROT|nr:MFS transporter [Falsiroseomonas bella]PWS34015.1 MFS transporter [Falsiroseomonas bella]